MSQSASAAHPNDTALPYYWVRTEDAPDGEPMEWAEGQWVLLGAEEWVSPEDAATKGWVYLHPLRKHEHRQTRRRRR